MEEEKIIELTNRVYKITLLFPKKEPLRYKIRETADDIASGITAIRTALKTNPIDFSIIKKEKQEFLFYELQKNFEILKTYFNIAKWQNWVSYFDILEIEEKYDEIYQSLQEMIKKSKDTETQSKVESQEIPQNIANEPKRKRSNVSLTERQKKILEFLEKNKRVQVWQVKQIFPNISKRTLRRDFEQLLKKGIIERKGERNNTFYEIKQQELDRTFDRQTLA